jgi:hypothetical protein
MDGAFWVLHPAVGIKPLGDHRSCVSVPGMQLGTDPARRLDVVRPLDALIHRHGTIMADGGTDPRPMLCVSTSHLSFYKGRARSQADHADSSDGVAPESSMRYIWISLSAG